MRLNNKGFTMVELLVVLLIIGVLAAIATPIYLANINRAKASEAVATMSLVRQALRDYWVSHNTYFDITTDDIQHALPSSVAGGVPTPANAGVVVDAGVAQYFSNASFTVDATSPAWVTIDNTQAGLPGAPVGFVVYVDGSLSAVCTSGSTNCAVHNGDVTNYRAQMDNSGRIFVCYGTCTTASNWNSW